MGTHYRGKPNERRALDALVKLRRSDAAVTERLAVSLHETELTENQFGVLEALLHLGPLAPCDLGTKILTSRPNVTLVLDQLEKRGLVRRERSTKDRRSLAIHLTGEGRKLIERIFPGHVVVVVEAFAPLTAAEQEELARLCKKLGTGRG
jgi:MarR family 2-MHQ and catechol resistance regulon transcriptional repressor